MDNPAPWFSRALSISSSLHLSAAAEPEPHQPACQSPLHTFNPSYPSLCKAALLAPHHPHPPFKTAPFHRSAEILLSLSQQHRSTCACAPEDSLTSTKHARGVIQMHMPMNAHAKTNRRAETAVLQCVHTGLHLFFSFCHAI